MDKLSIRDFLLNYINVLGFPVDPARSHIITFWDAT